MTVTELLQTAQFVVDAEGNRQAVQFDIARWEELVGLLENLERWEQEWRQPFDAIRAAWETSPPAPAETSTHVHKTLVDLVHQLRQESD